jgi:hypothetical protein
MAIAVPEDAYKTASVFSESKLVHRTARKNPLHAYGTRYTGFDCIPSSSCIFEKDPRQPYQHQPWKVTRFSLVMRRTCTQELRQVAASIDPLEEVKPIAIDVQLAASASLATWKPGTWNRQIKACDIIMYCVRSVPLSVQVTLSGSSLADLEARIWTSSPLERCRQKP